MPGILPRLMTTISDARRISAARRARETGANPLETRLLILGLVLVPVLLTASVIQPWIEPRWLYMDPQTVGELRGTCCHIYDGAISNLGVMLWAATAAIALFAAVLKADRAENYRFALVSSGVSTLLLLDDAFLLHEVAFPELGVPQSVVVMAVGLITSAYLVLGHRRFLRNGPVGMLMISLGLFAVSLGIDQVFSSITSLAITLEDGAKFAGIVFWCLFHLAFFRAELAQSPS